MLRSGLGPYATEVRAVLVGSGVNQPGVCFAMGREKRIAYGGLGCREKTYGRRQLNTSLPRLKIEQRHPSAIRSNAAPESAAVDSGWKSFEIGANPRHWTVLFVVGRYAMQGCDHRMPVRDVRRCADGVFEVAEKRANGLGL